MYEHRWINIYILGSDSNFIRGLQQQPGVSLCHARDDILEKKKEWAPEDGPRERWCCSSWLFYQLFMYYFTQDISFKCSKTGVSLRFLNTRLLLSSKGCSSEWFIKLPTKERLTLASPSVQFTRPHYCTAQPYFLTPIWTLSTLHY